MRWHEDVTHTKPKEGSNYNIQFHVYVPHAGIQINNIQNSFRKDDKTTERKHG